jgi:hypothetical protein
MLGAVGVEVGSNGGPLLAELQRVLQYFDVLRGGPLLLVELGRDVVEPALAALLWGDEAQRRGGLKVDRFADFVPRVGFVLPAFGDGYLTSLASSESWSGVQVWGLVLLRMQRAWNLSRSGFLFQKMALMSPHSRSG